jgi:prolyl oligopeptidase PreP (S9A serine peptidase family)
VLPDPTASVTFCAGVILVVSLRLCVVCRDGTRVPVFYVRAKTPEGVESPPKPCLLYGYGGFSVSLGPYFSSPRLVLLQELGAVFALAM